WTSSRKPGWSDHRPGPRPGRCLSVPRTFTTCSSRAT
ncbi:uncharacterized protein METZ01_LOCUS250930, partial [marine metagenome]